MTPWQAFFSRVLASHRVSVEWDFGKIANLWPWMDVVRSQRQVLHRDVGAYLRVANALANMHTCLHGSIVSSKFKVQVHPPLLVGAVHGRWSFLKINHSLVSC